MKRSTKTIQEVFHCDCGFNRVDEYTTTASHRHLRENRFKRRKGWYLYVIRATHEPGTNHYEED